MTQLVIMHGSNGSPEENWIPYLSTSFSEDEIEIVTPRLPIGEQQTLDNWRDAFNDQVGVLDHNSIVVGHSLACVFALNMLGEHGGIIKGAIFVSPFLHLLEDKEINASIASFVEHQHDWEKLRPQCPHGMVFHSDNDPYVPVKMAVDVAEKMLFPIRLIPHAGHFNTESGYDTFDELYGEVRKIINL